jgi:hypothetical protein
MVGKTLLSLCGPVGQEFRTGFTVRFWCGVSHEVTVKMAPEVAVF